MSQQANRGNLKRKIADAVEEVEGTGSNGKKYRCLAAIDADRKCVYEQTVFNPGNFKRHINACHPDVAKRLDIVTSESREKEQNTGKRTKPPKVQVDTTKIEVLLGTLQMITEHNLPTRYPEWEGTIRLYGKRVA